MVLTKLDIVKKINNGELLFDPGLDGFQVQPHAVDLRLGLHFHIPKTWDLVTEGRVAMHIDPLDQTNGKKNFDEVILKPGQYFELLPEEFIIATTLEKVTLNSPDIMAVLYPRSSINRRGLSVDLSGIIDVWYNGTLMIPIMNKTQKQVIRVYPGERICQLVFETLNTEISREEGMSHGLKNAKYQGGNNSTVSSKSDSNEEIDLIRSGKFGELKQKYPFKV